MRSIRIPRSEIEMTYVRSSGPGGQNVNKVNSKAVLRWNIHTSASLDLESRSWLGNRLAGKLSNDGDLVLTSDRFRDQARNREDCFEKFDQIIAAATTPVKSRKKTKPSFSSQRRVKESKARNSEKKSLRKSSRHHDE